MCRRSARMFAFSSKASSISPILSRPCSGSYLPIAPRSSSYWACTRDHIAATDDVPGAGKRGLGLGFVAPLVGVRDIVGVLVPDPRRVRQRRIGGRGDRAE